MCALVCVCVGFSADFHPYSINLTKKQATNIYIERIHHLLFCCLDVSRMAFFYANGIDLISVDDEQSWIKESMCIPKDG